MGLTVRDLKKMIEHANDDAPVILQDGSSIIHVMISDTVLLSSEKPIGYCKRCGEYVYPEKELEEYTAYCPNCDENMYSFEISPLV